MRLGVISDTHGHVLHTLDAVRMLDSLEVDHVLHCGDVGSSDILELLAGWPVDFVRGNVDWRDGDLRRAVEQAGLTYHGAFGDIELAGKRIALLHSDDERLFRQTIASGQWDLVCFGHTHRAEIRREGPTLLLNPGAVHRANPHTIAVVELPRLDAQIVPI